MCIILCKSAARESKRWAESNPSLTQENEKGWRLPHRNLRVFGPGTVSQERLASRLFGRCNCSSGWLLSNPSRCGPTKLYALAHFGTELGAVTTSSSSWYIESCYRYSSPPGLLYLGSRIQHSKRQEAYPPVSHHHCRHHLMSCSIAISASNLLNPDCSSHSHGGERQGQSQR